MFKNKKLWITLFVGLLLAVSGLVLIKYYVENNGHTLDGYDAISDEPKNKTSTITHVASTTKVTTKPSDDPNYKKYTSKAYGFSFLYPKEYVLDNSSDDTSWFQLKIQKPEGQDRLSNGYGSGVVITSLEDTYHDTPTTESNLLTRSVDITYALPCGPQGGVKGYYDCSMVTKQKKFYNSHNLLCTEYYLNVTLVSIIYPEGVPPAEATTTSSSRTDQGEIGPNYSCATSYKNNSSLKAILVYSEGFDSDQNTKQFLPMSTDNKKKIYDIVDSLQF
jgi:hypothetical protein